MRLAETQRLFWQIIAERRPVSRTTLEAVFVGTPALSVVERLEIYGSMYIHRLVDALASEFPATMRLLGDEAFFATAAAYVRAHPSVHPSITHVGRQLPSFLRGVRRRALAKRYPVLLRPDLAALATLERTRSVVFEAVDETPIGVAALAAVPADGLAGMALQPLRALTLFESHYAVAKLADRVLDGQEMLAPMKQREGIAVFRRDHVVHHVRLDAVEARALKAMLRGDSLTAVCTAFAECDDAAAVAQQIVARWFASGWITAIVRHEPTSPLLNGPQAVLRPPQRPPRPLFAPPP